MTEVVWMRIRRGRVMHAVREIGPGLPGWLRSRCYAWNRGRKTGVEMPQEDWTAERYWYPECQHCLRILEVDQ